MSQSIKEAFAKIKTLLSTVVEQEVAPETPAEPVVETPETEAPAEPTEVVEVPVAAAEEVPEVDEKAVKIAALETQLSELVAKFDELQAATTTKINEGVEKMATAMTQTLDAVEAQLSEPGAEPIQTPPNTFRKDNNKADKFSGFREAFNSIKEKN